MSRRHLINSSDVFVIKGFTVECITWYCYKIVFTNEMWWKYVRDPVFIFFDLVFFKHPVFEPPIFNLVLSPSPLQILISILIIFSSGLVLIQKADCVINWFAIWDWKYTKHWVQWDHLDHIDCRIRRRLLNSSYDFTQS